MKQRKKKCFILNNIRKKNTLSTKQWGTDYGCALLSGQIIL